MTEQHERRLARERLERMAGDITTLPKALRRASKTVLKTPLWDRWAAVARGWCGLPEGDADAAPIAGVMPDDARRAVAAVLRRQLRSMTAIDPLWVTSELEDDDWQEAPSVQSARNQAAIRAGMLASRVRTMCEALGAAAVAARKQAEYEARFTDEAIIRETEERAARKAENERKAAEREAELAKRPHGLEWTGSDLVNGWGMAADFVEEAERLLADLLGRGRAVAQWRTLRDEHAGCAPPTDVAGWIATTPFIADVIRRLLQHTLPLDPARPDDAPWPSHALDAIEHERARRRRVTSTPDGKRAAAAERKARQRDRDYAAVKAALRWDDGCALKDRDGLDCKGPLELNNKAGGGKAWRGSRGSDVEWQDAKAILEARGVEALRNRYEPACRRHNRRGRKARRGRP